MTFPVSVACLLLGGSSSSSNHNAGMEFLDCHHHFYDTKNNSFQSFLNRFQPNDAYLPSDYEREVIKPISESEALRSKGIQHTGSVHVESMPDNGLSEVQWIESLGAATTVQAIVASCQLADDPTIVRQNLQQLTKVSPKVRGIRWILDCVKNDEGDILRPATHANNLRHDGIDYLNDPEHSQTFEQGFKLLQEFNLSFDLQCAPSQLVKAAELCSRHSDIPVVINHLGKPMQLFGENNDEIVPNEAKLDEWRNGMAAMAKLPHVYVKISGLGWGVPNWKTSALGQDLVKKLCQETIELFGPERCMVATNWFKDASSADSDGLGDIGPSADEYLSFLLDWFRDDLSLEEQRMLFAGTARKFYKIGP